VFVGGEIAMCSGGGRTLNGSHPRGETFRKVIVRFGKEQNNIAVLGQGDGNSVRQREDISVQPRVYFVPAAQ
jgi:hypothetical protein